MITWRETDVSDGVAQMLLAEYFDDRAATFPGGPAAYARVTPDPATFTRPRGVFLVGFEGEDAAACGGIRRVASPDDAVWFEVKHLWVRPSHRGTGLGRQLLAELESLARDAGATAVVLDTNASQAAASSLYRSTGYEEIEPYNNNPNATHWFGKGLLTED